MVSEPTQSSLGARLKLFLILQDSEKNGKEEDEDDSFDYEDRVFAVMKAKVQKLDIHENLSFNHEEPGILEVGCVTLSIHILNSYHKDCVSRLL